MELKQATPKARIVAWTHYDQSGVDEALSDCGIYEWKPSGPDDACNLIELAGKSCYMSFDLAANKNLTMVNGRSNHDYIQQGIIGKQHGCYDEETEVLTADGWKSWKSVSMDDYFATRRQDGVIEYHKPNGLIRAEYSGRMYRVDGCGVDLLVTPNHNMYVCKTTTKQGRKREDFTLIQAQELGDVSHCYVKSGEWQDGVPFDKNIMMLLGFAIGDGSLNRHQKNKVVNFHLRRTRKITWLKKLVADAGLNMRISGNTYTVTIPDEYISYFNEIYNELGEKVIPRGLIMAIDKASAQALLAGLLESDGHRGERGEVCYDTTSFALAAQLQQLALHAGLASNYGYLVDKTKGVNSFGKKPLRRSFIISRSLKPEFNKKTPSCKSITQWVDDWSGIVYCAEVPNNTLYVRRNGQPVWCGNSVLEHATVSVMFTNVSRIVTHELVRHRAGTAFSQTSGRYVRNEVDTFYVPDAIEANPKVKAAYLKAIEGMNAALQAMEEATGVDSLPFAEKKALTSAFRRVVGNGQPNNLLMTANHRTWRHVIELRTSVHAEEEVRKVVRDLAIQLKHRFPTIYDDMSINDAGECVFKHSKV